LCPKEQDQASKTPAKEANKEEFTTCVRVVASAITNGTFTNLAKVFASRVFPVIHKTPPHVSHLPLLKETFRSDNTGLQQQNSSRGAAITYYNTHANKDLSCHLLFNRIKRHPSQSQPSRRHFIAPTRSSRTHKKHITLLQFDNIHFITLTIKSTCQATRPAKTPPPPPPPPPPSPCSKSIQDTTRKNQVISSPLRKRKKKKKYPCSEFDCFALPFLLDSK